jgi:hypothetical protein
MLDLLWYKLSDAEKDIAPKVPFSTVDIERPQVIESKGISYEKSS